MPTLLLALGPKACYLGSRLPETQRGGLIVTDARNHSDREPAAAPAGATSTTLLDLAKAGDAVAWQRLAFLYTPLVGWWCRRHGVAPQDVDDVTQEVLATVAVKLAEFTKGPAGGFFSWLCTNTRDKTREYHRPPPQPPVRPDGRAAQH